MKSHYLPCVFLSGFCDDHSLGRKSKIYLYNGKLCKLVQIETQGYERGFFEGEDEALIEKFFDVHFERPYGAVLRKIRNEKRLNCLDKIVILEMGLLLKFRNPSYKIEDGDMRFDAISGAMGGFLGVIAPQIESDASHPKNYIYRVYGKLGFCLLKLPGPIWVADDPVVIFSEPDSDEFTIMVQPVDSYHVAVWYNKKIFKSASNHQIATVDDYKMFLIIQKSFRRRHLYYCREIPAGDQEIPQGNPKREYVNGEFVFHEMPPYNNYFSFLDRK